MRTPHCAREHYQPVWRRHQPGTCQSASPRAGSPQRLCRSITVDSDKALFRPGHPDTQSAGLERQITPVAVGPMCLPRPSYRSYPAASTNQSASTGRQVNIHVASSVAIRSGAVLSEGQSTCRIWTRTTLICFRLVRPSAIDNRMHETGQAPIHTQTAHESKRYPSCGSESNVIHINKMYTNTIPNGQK